MGCFPVFSHFECARVPDVSRGAVAHTPPAASSTVSVEQTSLGECVCMLKWCVCECLCGGACLTLGWVGVASCALAKRLEPAPPEEDAVALAGAALPRPEIGNVAVDGRRRRGAIAVKA